MKIYKIKIIILSEKFINNGLTHSQTLMPMVEETLKDSGVSVKDIDLFAITNGPGSFTGVRIGIASVKGMADALAKPCFAGSTLEAIAEPLKNKDCVACAVMDARCNQVYTAIFENGNRLCEDKAVLIDELGEELKQYNRKVVFIGDGAKICYEKLSGILDNAEIAEKMAVRQHSGKVANVLLGAVFVGILENGMTLLNISSYVQQVVQGVVLVAAIAFDVYKTRRQAASK